MQQKHLVSRVSNQFMVVTRNRKEFPYDKLYLQKKKKGWLTSKTNKFNKATRHKDRI